MTKDEVPKHLTRDWIYKHRSEVIVIFGDNLHKKGYGGQAEACRGCTNAYGVPTKRTPCRDESVCYFTDTLYDVFCWNIDISIAEVPRDGRLIYVIPGIGEGHAQMPKRAPKVFEYLMKRLNEEFGYERSTK
jgi:hypothetical protein